MQPNNPVKRFCFRFTEAFKEGCYDMITDSMQQNRNKDYNTTNTPSCADPDFILRAAHRKADLIIK